MMFPNARKATKLMNYSTTLLIVVLVLNILEELFAYLGKNGDVADTVPVFLMLGISGVLFYILTIISAVFVIIALFIGARDERFFKYGFFLIIGSIIAVIILLATNIMATNPIVSNVFGYVSKLLSSIVHVIICVAISRLYKKKDEPKMVRHGHITAIIILVGILCAEASGILADMGDTAVFYTTLKAVSVILSLARLIIYSLFLRKARRTL